MMNYSLWKVTYTKQKVQKTKLYHDGILTLKLVASSQCKAILSTEDGAYLDEMFLGRNDEVENGKILEFPFFLVDVCGSLPDGDPLSILNQGVKSARNVEVAKESTARKSSHYYKKARNASTCQPEIIKNNAAEGETGETSSLTSIEEASKESLELPFRNVSQILECLKRPQHVEYGRPDKYESSKITQVLNLEKKAALPTPNAEKRIQLDKHYSNQFALKSLPKGSDGPKKPFAKQLHNLENHIKSSWQKLDSMCKRPQNLLKQVKGFQNAGTTSSSVTCRWPSLQTITAFQEKSCLLLQAQNLPVSMDLLSYKLQRRLVVV
ncbi:hypothetical protein O6H91_22G017300 [Diphasiastrum complanatum]|uniref:Uncharacterized protein n=1 Tax=Diphasiastrum complanatum TaxID=34168 RepID=A0ACC2AD99_DIPCM|nr:hypothetical protein O6H91_22G017300 [Diphasiastrum complanatum]